MASKEQIRYKAGDAKINYKVEKDIPYEMVTRLDLENPEYVFMKTMKVGESFVYANARMRYVYNARKYFHKHFADQYCFANAPARDKNGIRIDGFSRCWRIEINKRRLPRKKSNPK